MPITLATVFLGCSKHSKFLVGSYFAGNVWSLDVYRWSRLHILAEHCLADCLLRGKSRKHRRCNEDSVGHPGWVGEPSSGPAVLTVYIYHCNTDGSLQSTRLLGQDNTPSHTNRQLEQKMKITHRLCLVVLVILMNPIKMTHSYNYSIRIGKASQFRDVDHRKRRNDNHDRVRVSKEM